MVRLFRGARGRGVPRAPMMMPRHLRPHEYEPDFIAPFHEPDFIAPYDVPRGRLLRGHPGRIGPPGPHPPPPRRMVPPPLQPLSHRHLPLPPHQPLHPREMPVPLPRRPLPRDMPIHLGLGLSRRPPRDMPIPVSRRPPPRVIPIPASRGPLPLHLRGRRPGMPLPINPMPPGPPLRRPLRPGLPLLRRGRGGILRRGAAVKRLGSSANGRPKKKEKTEGDFFCETCDRTWKTQEKLHEHIAEHQVCGRDGCTFTAHPKVILKHVQQQHESGLYHRIVFTENPADVAKWIAERKSRFPTKQNIEKKEAQTSEMMERGERITSQGKRFECRGRFGNRGDRRQRGNENHSNSEAGPKQRKAKLKMTKTVDDSKWKDPDAWRGNLPQFPGTAAFPHLVDSTDKVSTEEKHFSDDDEWVEIKSENNLEKPAVSNVLSLLMLNYGSDVSDDDECGSTNPQRKEPLVFCNEKIVEKVTIKKVEESCYLPKNNNSKGEIITTNNNDSDSGPEECIVEREDKLNIPIPSPKKEREPKLMKTPPVEPSSKIVLRPKAPIVKPYFKKHQLSLLEKLLRNEIRHERNVILQCVRYVVKNNFLGCENTEKFDQ